MAGEEDNQKDQQQKEQNGSNDGSQKGGKGNDTPRSTRSSETPRDGRKKQKEHFKEELKRLKTSLDKESSKIKAPPKKEHSPYVFNSLEPYYNTSTPSYLIELPEEIKYGHVSRNTAIGLTDPWIDHEMDVTLPPKVDNSVPVHPDDEDDSKKKKKEKDETPRKEGSTRLPKYPAVAVRTEDPNKLLSYADVPMLRRELEEKYSSNAQEKQDADYRRTKADFYRMELDKMDEYHPVSRPNMRKAYFAYLQNNPGSKKAVYECVGEAENKNKKNKDKKDKKQDNRQDNKQSEKQKQDNKDKEEKDEDKDEDKDDNVKRDDRAEDSS